MLAVSAVNSVVATILGHRSIRKYKRYKIPEEHINAIEEAAQRAPTDATLHLWTALRIDDQMKRATIAELIRQDHVAEASLFYIYTADLYRLYKILEHANIEHSEDDYALLIFAAIDAAIAAENMAIAAESLGYGTCFIGAVQNAASQIIQLLHLPTKTYPLFGLTIGLPAENPEKRPRLPREMLIHVDQYRSYDQDALDRAIQAMNKISRRRSWINIIARYAAKGGYFEARSREMKRLLGKQGFTGV